MGETNPHILIEDRPENKQGMQDLKLTHADCIRYIAALTPNHLCQKLQSDDLKEAAAGRHLWVFGVLVGKATKKQRAAYVKVQLGRTHADPICISFHPPKFRLSFVFPSAHILPFQQAYDAQSKHR